MGDRNSLSSYRFVAVMFAQFFVQVFMLPIIETAGGGDKAQGIEIVMTWLAVIGTVMLLITFFTTRERIIPKPEQKSSVREDLADLIKSRPWLIMLILTTLLFITLAMKGGSYVYYFKNYDPLNTVYIMAFSGARGNLSQVRQLVGMRGLMSDPSGQIMNLPIKKNFREGLTITDYLMSGYGARKGIVDTALKTANSGYLTRRLIDVSQDILIREKDCQTSHSFVFSIKNFTNQQDIFDKILGRVLNKPIYDPHTSTLLVKQNTQITPELIRTLKDLSLIHI